MHILYGVLSVVSILDCTKCLMGKKVNMYLTNNLPVVVILDLIAMSNQLETNLFKVSRGDDNVIWETH